MIQTLNHSSHLLTKLLIIGAIVLAFKYKSEIKDFVKQNDTTQELSSSLKWVFNELRPLTEAEKKQRAAYAAEQRKQTAELKKMGVNPNMEYVSSDDKRWKEAASDYGKLMRGESL